MAVISIEDFQNLDICIGTVTEAQVPEWSHWVIKITADFGKDIGKKICFSGIMKFYTAEDLIGNQYPFVINLEPKKIGPDRELSEAMMLMAVPGETEEDKPILFNLSEQVPNGTKVY